MRLQFSGLALRESHPHTHTLSHAITHTHKPETLETPQDAAQHAYNLQASKMIIYTHAHTHTKPHAPFTHTLSHTQLHARTHII